ncbi:MAG: hypothetical protein A3B86_02050 [Candidatus Yanofskybacteria bacterium RIFCSPHIGHO2_02_FULL_38_22b]|uniref:Uncharacterized protein n=1 Tax=Candidatus Yanofskybacteria bacterium RIFCSPHIGHO2_02_FULL_38_22b TaxID=1802673 RepID=A0A1F8F201_9BACT|nr:MAG: hypothetical protein A3B86_02050 [Candidatus Yanofskybacteria bacterium RIFCSPHIGHO2_02_FULL_38_22b]OGN20017.1 MAG: hypothetical protein A2910_00760 [Candidatus Yanofskybacteria bacterium RIFCSPLOWO2_01_FULL_39_28]
MTEKIGQRKSNFSHKIPTHIGETQIRQSAEGNTEGTPTFGRGPVETLILSLLKDQDGRRTI